MNHCNCKPLPGWEAYQPKADKPEPMLALWDPADWEPSGQQLTDRQRLTSKLTPEQEASYGLTPPQPVAPLPKRRK